MFQKPHAKKADVVAASLPAESPISAPAGAGLQIEEVAPFTGSFLEQLFGTLSEQLATFKRDIVADIKNLKKDCNKLGHRVNALEHAGNSHEEEQEAHRQELITFKDKNEDLLYQLEVPGLQHLAQKGSSTDRL
ncbi:hypothetical protein NDU88_004057 [Pleurodeles waltl]|uniref:Uncharacterized protein n=1 Tax=Pleurodeles waltl TaxID=8319 RepID=A0AAV7TRH9_PLEWA|nr:hypothetical protein NDU88_004057 [Pleurodeles waltl]